MKYIVPYWILLELGRKDTSSATTSSSFPLLVVLALFLRKIRDLEQRCGADAAHHLSYQR